MSAAQDSIPPTGGRSSDTRPRGGGGGSSSSRGRGGSSRGNGRRANFGGSLTGSPTDGSNASNNRSRTNQSRNSRPRLQQRQTQQQHQQEASLTDEEPSASIAAASTDDEAAPVQPNAADAEEDDDDDELPPEADVCFICADPIKLTSVAPCDHRTCHICALRLRVLYKKDDCTFCKTRIDHLIFTSYPNKPFSAFTPSDTPYHDKKLPISFETKEALEETVLLLRFNCPDPNCEVACTGWRDYKDHVKRDHKRLVCQLCISNKKIFAHEHTLHTDQSLSAHLKEEHRLCEYDNQRFYGDDELFAHMRDKHEQCHICKARGGEEERWKYYRDYDMLEKHFRRDHWLCGNKECLDQKFVVFESEVDYKAHQVEVHGNELSSREKREAARIEANFGFEDPAEGSSRGKKGKSRGGSGNTNGADAGPSEPRDVLGVSQLASRSHVPGAGPANHASRRALFGSGLTTPSPATPTPTLTDNRTTEQKHQSYMDRVSSALNASESRITSFRSSVRLFKHNECSARDLISTIHSLVGDMDDASPLVQGLADLLEDPDKVQALRDAWNGYRVERTQFPSLTPSGSGAVKNIKRSSQANTQIWDNVERAASSSSGFGAGRPVALREHFPSLGSAGASSGSTSIPGSLAHAVAHGSKSRAAGPGAKWSAASSVGASGRSTPTPKPFVARVHTLGGGRSVNASSSSAFPSLPTNKDRASINAQKKALFANKSAAGSGKHSPNEGSSGTSTPWIPQPGRIDDFPQIEGAGGGGLGSLNGINEALVASQRDARGAEGGGKGKGRKGKGVTLAAFGGVHRG